MHTPNPKPYQSLIENLVDARSILCQRPYEDPSNTIKALCPQNDSELENPKHEISRGHPRVANEVRAGHVVKDTGLLGFSKGFRVLGFWGFRVYGFSV